MAKQGCVRLILAAAAGIMLVLLSGCTTIGPFVTNVSKDDDGNILVEKSTLELNTFSGNMALRDRSISTIRIRKGGQNE